MENPLNLKDGLPLPMDTLHPDYNSDDSRRPSFDDSHRSSCDTSRRASHTEDSDLLNPDFGSVSIMEDQEALLAKSSPTTAVKTLGPATTKTAADNHTLNSPNPNDSGTTPPPPRRLPHLHKLEKKHSSGDLHSRLKTRKLLGVGETDDGDVHRSKLSQILGHSDQLYVRLPPGLRAWQLILAVIFTIVAFWALAFPAHLFDIAFESDEGKYLSLPIRLYGTALLSLSLVYWGTLQSSDREIIRMALLSSIVYFTLQILVTGYDILLTNTESTQQSNVLIGCRLLFAFISFIYYYLVGDKLISIRRSASTKELQEQEKKQ